MLKKGLSFIASEDYSFGFTALKRIVMIRFSLQGRHVFTALKKWTFSCRHLASLLLGSLWKKKKTHHFPPCMYTLPLHVWYLLEANLMTTATISTIFQPLPIDWHTPPLQWHLRQKEHRAWCPDTCNMQQLSTLQLEKSTKKNIQLRSFKKPSAPVHPWCFCRCPQQRQKIGGCLEVKFVVVQRSFLHQVACSEKQIVSKIS